MKRLHNTSMDNKAEKTVLRPSMPRITSSVSIKKGLSYKILFAVLPLLIITVFFLGVTTYFSSNNGITGIAKEFVGYKMQEVYKIAQQQLFRQSLLPPGEIDVRSNVLEYAKKFTTETFIIIPFDGQFNPPSISYWSAQTNIAMDELKELHSIIDTLEKTVPADKRNNWLNYTTVAGVKRVGVFVPYRDLGAWLVMVLPFDFFYSPVYNVMRYILIILVISIVVTTAILLWFIRLITKPLRESVQTIQSITENIDLTRRIRVYYPDEIGALGQYFNDMIAELENAYNQVKNYAYQTVLAKRKEEQIRFIFQKYVPSDVIDHVLNRSSDSLLVGSKTKISVLFSDIRGFTSISEQLKPEDLVTSLNAYFNKMVDEILNRHGIIDKFIGDAIMAVFGAPKVRADDADNAVEASLGMIDVLQLFNEVQIQQGRIPFQIGIGINTGDAIVGNIGSEQKIDFTVIGDSVNLASRLEGLTKSYQTPILISEFTKDSLVNPSRYYFFNIDTVRVKGKDKPVKIYRPVHKKSLSAQELELFESWHEAIALYYRGSFFEALPRFQGLSRNPSLAFLASLYSDRCAYLISSPPQDWDGVTTWETK